MAIVTSLPVSTILRTLWDDLGTVTVRLRSQSLIAIAIVIVFEVIGSIPAISGNRLLSEAFGLTSTIATLPFEIAIYRLLILDEPTSGYHFALSTVRFQRMLGWRAALWALAAMITYLPDAIAPSATASLVFSFILIVIAIVVTLRLSILFPAIAVDAPGASVRNVFADTRGHALLILKVYLTILLPLLVIIMSAVLLAWLGGVSGALGRSGGLMASVLSGILGFLATSAATIVAARLFMSLGERVKGEPPAAAIIQPGR